MTTADHLRAELRDRNGQRLIVTAGVDKNGEAVYAIARPGHEPLVQLAADLKQHQGLTDVVLAVWAAQQRHHRGLS